jgi:hypothetical protein
MSTNPLPAEVLEQRAAEQRRRLHNTVSELRTTVRGTVREKLDIKANARHYMLPASATVGLIGLVFGYGFAGMFTRR